MSRLARAALAVSLAAAGPAVLASAPLAAENARDALSDPATHEVAITNPEALAPWFRAVAAGGPLRVLHLGDSHLARDTFAGDLRAALAGRAGAGARGMLPPGPVYPFHMARGVELDMSPDWTVAAAMDEAAAGPFGLASARAEAEAGTDAWIALSAIEGPAARLVIGYLRQPRGGAVQVLADGAVSAFTTDTGVGDGGAGDGAAGHAFAAVPLSPNVQLVRVAAAGNGPVTLTSLALEADTGAAQVTSFGWPGATAEIMARWDDAILRAELDRLSPQLIVVSYGTNEGFDDDLETDGYAALFEAQIRRLRRLAPGAAVLVTGGPDGTRLPGFVDPDARAPDEWTCAALTPDERESYAALVDGEAAALARWHDPPNLAPVLAAQARAAAAAGAAHWDWRAAMGGACAVHGWRLAEPPFARPDHVHLTAEGYAASAAALLAALDGAFVAWTGAGEGVSVP